MKQQKMTRKQELVAAEAYDRRERTPVSYIGDDYVKVLDKNGVSIQPRNFEYKTNKYLKKDVRVSKNGAKPYVCYPDSDFEQPATTIKVVKKYAKYEKHMQNARKALMREANNVSNTAAQKYHDEVERAKLLTEKNLLAARISSLRLTNKAMLIEKNYNENFAETVRHKQVVSDIEKLKRVWLENNDINLKERLAEIDLNRELELDNAKSNKEKISERISEQMEINKVKNEFMKERIRILSTGATPKNMKKEQEQEIQRVRENRSFRERDDEELTVLYSALKRMDIEKIANKNDRELAARIISKFESDKKIKALNENYMRINDDKTYTAEKVHGIRARIFKIVNRKYAAQIDNELQKKITLDAKKATLSVSMSVEKLMATNQRTLHAVFEDFPSTKKAPAKKSKPAAKKKSASKAKKATSTALVVSTKKKPAAKRKPAARKPAAQQHYVHYFDEGFTSFQLDDEFFAQKGVRDAIKKWKRIENRVESSDEFEVDPRDRDTYKIRYNKLRAEKDASAKSFLKFLMTKTAREEQDEAARAKKEQIKKAKKNANKSSNPESLVKYYSPFKLMALRRRLEKLPNDPVIFNSRNGYEYRHLMDIIAEFSQMPLSRLPKTPQNDSFIIEVKQIIDYYDELIQQDKIARHNVEKSMSLDAKLRGKQVRNESKVITWQSQNDLRYQKKVASIEQDARMAIDQANRQHTTQKQKINKEVQWQVENETDLHEKNLAFIKRTSTDLENRSHIYENDQMRAMAREVAAFNARQKDERKLIDMSDMPTMIECTTPSTDAKIDLIEQEDGVYAVTRTYSRGKTTTYTGKTFNKKLPENVTKVVVLDKYRRINNPLVKAAALKELAEVQYMNAVETNAIREKNEIQRAQAALNKSKEYSDSLVDDSFTMHEYLELTRSKSRYSNFVQNEHLKRSATKWRITEGNLKRQYKIESAELKRLESQNRKLELAQKRIEARRDKYLSSMENDVLFESLRATKENSMTSSKSSRDASIVPYYGYEKANKAAKGNSASAFFKKVAGIFKFKKNQEDDIDDIVGKK